MVHNVWLYAEIFGIHTYADGGMVMIIHAKWCKASVVCVFGAANFQLTLNYTVHIWCVYLTFSRIRIGIFYVYVRVKPFTSVSSTHIHSRKCTKPPHRRVYAQPNMIYHYHSHINWFTFNLPPPPPFNIFWIKS